MFMPRTNLGYISPYPTQTSQQRIACASSPTTGRNPGPLACLPGPYLIRQLLNEPMPSPIGPRPDDSMFFSDPDGYLRICIANYDWDGVARWYASKIWQIQQNTQDPNQFFALATLDLRAYSNRSFTLGDLAAFSMKCILPMYIMNNRGNLSIGISPDSYSGPSYLNYSYLDKAAVALSYTRICDDDWGAKIFAAQNGTYPCLALGWDTINGPGWFDYFVMAVIVIGFAAVTYGGVSAILAPAAAPVATGAASTVEVAAPVAAPVAVAAPIATETVVVTAAPIVAAADVAAASAAAAAADIAASAVTAQPAPVESAPAPAPIPAVESAPVATPLETVVTTAAPITDTATTAVAATAAAAATAASIAASTPTQPSYDVQETSAQNQYMDSSEVAPQETVTTEASALPASSGGTEATAAAAAAALLLASGSGAVPPSAGQPLETVTTESTPLQEPSPSGINPTLVDAGALLAAGLLTPGSQGTATGGSSDEGSQPGNNSGENQSSNNDPNSSWIDALKNFGLNALKNLLTQLAKYYLGRALTPGEQQSYNDYFACLNAGRTDCVPPDIGGGNTLTPRGVVTIPKKSDALIYLVIALILVAIASRRRRKKKGVK